MAKTFEKKIVIEFDGIRIVRSDELNFAVERLVETEKGETWKHVGFGGTVDTCLKNIYLKDMLINHDEIDSLEKYILQQADACKQILLKLDELGSKK